MEGKERQVEEVDERDLVNMIESTSKAYNEKLTQVDQFLWTGRIELGDSEEKRMLCRRALKLVVWQGWLIRRGGQKVVAVVLRAHGEGMMKFMHHSMRHWNARTTRRMITDRYWWPKADQDVFRCVKTWDPCQRMKKMPAYHMDFDETNHEFVRSFLDILLWVLP